LVIVSVQKNLYHALDDEIQQLVLSSQEKKKKERIDYWLLYRILKKIERVSFLYNFDFHARLVF